jgi:pilus assembly protein CpaB
VKILAIGTRLGQIAQSTGKDGEGEGEASEDGAKTTDTSVFQGGTIATLELTPAQGELIINATKMGQLSVVLRSIADFAQVPGDVLRNETSRAITMIRFGRGESIMPSDAGSGQAGVSQASYEDASSPDEAAEQPDEAKPEEQAE